MLVVGMMKLTPSRVGKCRHSIQAVFARLEEAVLW